MKRVAILVVTLLIAASAPGRAWCEASCLAPVHASDAGTPHCPAHEQPVDSPSVTAADSADCPTLETARPSQAKLHLAVAPAAITARAMAPPVLLNSATSHAHSRAPAHLTHLLLRI